MLSFFYYKKYLDVVKEILFNEQLSIMIRDYSLNLYFFMGRSPDTLSIL